MAESVSQYMTIEGLEVVVHSWPCGCWHEEGYSTGELVHLRFQACSSCWDAAGEYLTQLTLDKRSQLTLPLPSSHGAAKNSHGTFETDDRALS